MSDFYMADSLYILLHYVLQTHRITSVLHTSLSVQAEGCCVSASWTFRNANLSGWPTQTIKSHCLSWLRTAGRKQILNFTTASGQHTSKMSKSHTAEYICFQTKNDRTLQEIT